MMELCTGFCCLVPCLLIIIVTVLAIIGSMKENASWKKAAEEVKKKKHDSPSYIYKKPKTKYHVEVKDVGDGKL